MPAQEYLIIKHLTIKEIACLFSHVKITNSGCWEWLAGQSGKYGKVKFRQRTELAHRLFYAWLVAPLPRRQKGKKTPQLDHVVCSYPRCCNPAHVKLVTPQENTLRSNNPPAQNARKIHCTRGHVLPSAPNGNGTYGRECRACKSEKYHSMTSQQRKQRQERMAKNYIRRKQQLTQGFTHHASTDL